MVRVMARQRQALAAIESSQEEITSEVARLQAKVEETAAAAAEYRQQLVLNQERLEKLPQLQRVSEVPCVCVCALHVCARGHS